MKNSHLVLDIGGTWIKGVCIDILEYEAVRGKQDRGGLQHLVRKPQRLKSSFPDGPSFSRALETFAKKCADGKKLGSIVISTAGLVDPAGTHVVKCADHLAFLRESTWKGELQTALDCPVYLVNDGEAFMLGAAELGYIPRTGTVASLIIGTGLGFSVVKDGRWWRPGRATPFLGSIRIGDNRYELLTSTVKLTNMAGDKGLLSWFTAGEYASSREQFWSNLAGMVITSAILFGADKVLIGGGFCEAALHAGINIISELDRHLQEIPPELDKLPMVEVVAEGNASQLLGAASLCMGPLTEEVSGPDSGFDGLATEQTDPRAANLHKMSPREIVDLLWEAEQEAGNALDKSLGTAAKIVSHVEEQWARGGRIIYVGAGTSGRVAALDSVEIPCTFGVAPDRVVAVVAGGIADACLSIESGNEEDCSSVPDMVLLDLKPQDTVVGISASGTAFFVRSALMFAKRKGAATALVQVSLPSESHADSDWVVSLSSGVEIVSGSTRMKAGTATKKILNFLTTAVMVRCGKVRGPYMVNITCPNRKIVARAKRILREMFGVSGAEAEILLKQHGFVLQRVIEHLDSRSSHERNS